MLIKNHPNIPNMSIEVINYDLRPFNIKNWKLRAVAAKKEVASAKTVILLPDQPKSYLKPKRFDFL